MLILGLSGFRELKFLVPFFFTIFSILLPEHSLKTASVRGWITQETNSEIDVQPDILLGSELSLWVAGGGDGGKTGQRAELSRDAAIIEDSAGSGGAQELGWPSKLCQLRRGAGLVPPLVIGYRPPLTPTRKET